jgi:hypothetical protein
MDFLLGFLFLLFSLKVPAIFWVYITLSSICISLANYMKKDKEGDKAELIKPENYIGIYPIMLLLDSNLALFAKFGYIHINWLYNTFMILGWFGISITILLFFVYIFVKALDK